MKFKSYYLLLALVLLFSCNKDEVKPPKKSPLEILTGTTWQIDEIRFLQLNQPYYYKRGASSGNNANYDNEYIQFNKDNTGVRSDNGEKYPLTWSFTDESKTKIKIVTQESSELVIYWENITYDEAALKYTEYYNRNGTNSLGVATRTPNTSISK
ncbi:MAG: hypothetical protein QM802_08135 [Agriterribacter sp.]